MADQQVATLENKLVVFTFSDFAVYMVIYTYLFYLLLAIAEVSSLLWRPISIILYGGILFFSILIITAFFINPQSITSIGKQQRSDDVSNNFAMMLASLMSFIVAFSEICRHLALTFGGFVARQFGFWHWIRLGVAWVFDNMLFNASQIFGWNISEIQAVTLWTRLIVFAFNVCLELLVFGTIFQAFSFVRKNLSKDPVSRKHTFGGIFISRLGTLIGSAFWVLPLIIFGGAVVDNRFSLGTSWNALKAGTPVFFGLWISWQGLIGLGLPRFGNKLLAFLCLAGGIVLTWSLLTPFHH